MHGKVVHERPVATVPCLAVDTPVADVAHADSIRASVVGFVPYWVKGCDARLSYEVAFGEVDEEECPSC